MQPDDNIPLDNDALARLRQAVHEIQQHQGEGVPLRQLVAMSDEVGLDAGITVDFLAVANLGQPLVVLRQQIEPSEPEWLAQLSPRQQEVARLVSKGLSNKEIASQLFISLATVKDHVHNVLARTGLESRTALASQWQAPRAEG